MRLQGISDIETANAWLPTFIEAYNNRFATPPRIADNAHLDVHHSEEELGYIFQPPCEARSLQKSHFPVQKQCVSDSQ